MAASPHGFHELSVREVIRETHDANSFVLDPPFQYEAGQFITFRVRVNGEPLLRSYSMSSAPGVDDDFKVTVKRVPGGVVSNWLNDNVTCGSVLEATRPAGVFCLPPGSREVACFAAGSGITPVISIIKRAMADRATRVRLLYANRDRDSIIFANELDELGVDVVHHLDAEDGFVTADVVSKFVGDGAEYFICGPGPFMDIAERALLTGGVASERIHIERFTTVDEPIVDKPADGTKVTIELGGKTATADHYPGTTVLQTARQAGLRPPYSCESGSCASCMARLVDGSVSMKVNNALTDDEVAEGWILTCQSVPTTPTLHVVYEDM